MNKRIVVLAGILMVSLVMLACSLPFFEVQLQPKDIQAISDSVLKTLVVFNNQQSQLQSMRNSDVIASAVAQTVVAQNQATQTASAVSTIIPYVYAAPVVMPYRCNSVNLVYESVPDYSQLDLNQTFYKTWRLKNVGACTWNTGYRLAFFSGSSLDAPSYVYMPYIVAPGGTVDITMLMQAPSYYGTFTGYWGLYTDQNLYFGKVWVTITTDDSSIPAYFAVTSVTYAIDHASQEIDCASSTNVTFNIQANITTNEAGIVTYYWLLSDGTQTATQTLTFGSASTQTVLLSHTISGAAAAGDYWVKIYDDAPNHQLFSPMAFHITCASTPTPTPTDTPTQTPTPTETPTPTPTPTDTPTSTPTT